MFDLKIYIDLFKYNLHIQVIFITTKYAANLLSILLHFIQNILNVCNRQFRTCIFCDMFY